MVAYEFYLRDPKEEFHLIGILPKRRKVPERVTEESIMRWGKIILGDNVDLSNLLFTQVTIDERTGEVSL